MIRKKQTRKSKFLESYSSPEIAELLVAHGIGVLPTDTLYGVVASTLAQQAVERVYNVKGRTGSKPPIILISNLNQLDLFGVPLPAKEKAAQYWPGPTSVVLECNSEEFRYLHRGNNSLAFRLPAKQEILQLIEKIGPLIAPSANPEGKVPAETIEVAQSYFGDRVDFYVDGGKLAGKPSKIISLLNGTTRILRK